MCRANPCRLQLSTAAHNIRDDTSCATPRPDCYCCRRQNEGIFYRETNARISSYGLLGLAQLIVTVVAFECQARMLPFRRGRTRSPFRLVVATVERPFFATPCSPRASTLLCKTAWCVRYFRSLNLSNFPPGAARSQERRAIQCKPGHFRCEWDSVKTKSTNYTNYCSVWCLIFISAALLWRACWTRSPVHPSFLVCAAGPQS